MLLVWQLAGFSALAWDHCRLKSDQWQCEGQGVNLNLLLSPGFQLVKMGGLRWINVSDLPYTGRVGRAGHCLCFLTHVIVGISVVSQHRQELLV